MASFVLLCSASAIGLLIQKTRSNARERQAVIAKDTAKSQVEAEKQKLIQAEQARLQASHDEIGTKVAALAPGFTYDASAVDSGS